MLPLKQSFLLLLQRRQVQTSMIRLRASRLAAVMAELSGIGAEIKKMLRLRRPGLPGG